MTFRPTERQRELELVSMMLADRQLLHREFRELTGYDHEMVFDRDMVRLILDREYAAKTDGQPPGKPR